jgi:hypothetical protein
MEKQSRVSLLLVVLQFIVSRFLVGIEWVGAWLVGLVVNLRPQTPQHIRGG